MTDTPQLVIYTLEFCPNCELLKGYLTRRGIPYVERDMQTPASLTELRVNGVFVQEAPVLQHQSSFLTSRDLFFSGIVREDQVNRLIEGV
jgi:glutaredoxin